MSTTKDSKNTSGPHNFSLKDRKFLSMDGVKEVISFNEEKITLETNQGNLSIKGEKLNIKKLNLDDSNMEVEGFISSLDYTAKAGKKGLISRLFK